jgi:hypothetical protein
VSAGRQVSAVDITFTPVGPVPAAAAAPREDATGTARIAGIVTDAVSGKPVAGARLLLLPVEGQRLTNWTRTDARGRFEYTKLQARRYTLQANADRFVTLEYGQKRPGETGTQIQLTEGEQFRADVKLPRTSAIEGRLLDEFGDAAPSVLVQAARRLYASGRHRIIPVGGPIAPAPSDDRGHFRLTGLAPGDYYVVALSGAFTDAGAVGGFAPTYYPGTTDAGGAAPIAVEFGGDSIATFALSPAKTMSIAGTMVDAEGRPVAGRGTLMLVTPDRLRRMDFNMARAATAPDGTFVLRNVPQGQYTMQGFGPPAPGYRGPMNLGAMSFGWLPVAVGDADLDGVVLRVTGGATLRGTIVLEGDASPPNPDAVHVSASPVEFDSAPIGGGPAPSETHADWTFEVTHLSGLRRIHVSVQAPAWALKRITRNDLDVTDAPLDFREKDVDDVKVVLTAKVTRLTGAVSDDKGPIGDYAVVVFSTDPTKWNERSRFVALGRPTQQGRFSLAGLPPDDYLAIALPNVVALEYFDPEFLQQLRAQATPFSLAEGQTITLDLKLKNRP